MTASSDDAAWTPPATRELTTSDGRVLQYAVPFDADGLDWWAGMSPGNVEEFTLARTDLPAYRAMVERIGNAAADRIRAGEVAIPPEYELAESDLALFRQRLQEHNPGRVEVGIRSWTCGFDGWVDDGVALTQPWGFAVSSVSVPVSVWFGPDDVLCPRGHTEWLLAHVPAAERRELSGGHGLADRDIESLYDWLAA